MPNTGPSYLKSLKTGNTAEESRLGVLEEKEAAVATFAVDGALTKTSGVKRLTKGSAGAYSLAAPTANEEGTEVTIVNQTAFAHVVTATGLIDDGVTGGSKNTMTFGAFVGASIRVMAVNLKWVVVTKNVVTVA